MDKVLVAYTYSVLVFGLHSENLREFSEYIPKVCICHKKYLFLTKKIMLTYSELIQIIFDTSHLNETGCEREIEKQIKKILFTARPIKVITGIRRSGKSFLLKRLYQKILAKNVPAKNILFLNFEDDRLTPYLSLKSLRKIYELFITYADNTKPVFLFFDEIQNINGWEKFIRTIYDTTSHNIFITGSNSELLSGEFAGVLGGRLIEFKLHPFSLPEVLKYNGLNMKDEFLVAQNRLKINRLTQKYFNLGGFPETLTFDEKTTLLYRHSLIEKIIIKDIITRYKIENPQILEKLVDFLEKNIGNIISYNNLSRLTKLSDKTVENYMHYLQNAFIGRVLNKFSWKTKEIFTRQKKFFFTDNLFAFYADIEDKLENFVFSHLIRHFEPKQIFFGRDERGKEIDFLIKTDAGKFIAIQVCAELTDENFNREIGSFILFDKYINRKNAKFILVFRDNNSTKLLPEWIIPLNFTQIADYFD